LYTEDERKLWAKDPAAYHLYRRSIEDGIMAYMAESGFTYGSPEQRKMEVDFRAHMKSALSSRPEILETLLPDFPPGCRRLVPGPGYLEAVVKDNVEWIPEELDKVTPDGIMTKDGALHECDAIIWATGFIWFGLLQAAQSSPTLADLHS
jgi:cation diffusion facilitator CzcD-associated flavoprotein CzcO